MTDSTILRTDGGEVFASGSARYRDTHPDTQEAEPRIYVRFRPPGLRASFLALLDTGAHYCILNQDIVDLVQDRLIDPLGETVLRTAHGPVRGALHILRIELIADTGDHLDLDVVAFISPEWRAPSFIGYTGMLERLRFAVDPQNNRFFFGRLTPYHEIESILLNARLTRRAAESLDVSVDEGELEKMFQESMRDVITMSRFDFDRTLRDSIHKTSLLLGDDYSYQKSESVAKQIRSTYECLQGFDELKKVVPAKEVLKEFRRKFELRYKAGLTIGRLTRFLQKEDIPTSVAYLLSRIHGAG